MKPRAIAQATLGAFLATAGTLHLTTQREEFQAQVPPWVPLDADLVVLLSGAKKKVIAVRAPRKSRFARLRGGRGLGLFALSGDFGRPRRY